MMMMHNNNNRWVLWEGLWEFLWEGLWEGLWRIHEGTCSSYACVILIETRFIPGLPPEFHVYYEESSYSIRIIIIMNIKSYFT